jgi:cysteine-rich repeat protein
MPGSPDTCWNLCGDGRVVNVEECDDGNNVNIVGTNTDGCNNCLIVQGWECKYGTPYHASLCTEICGDGIDYFHYPCDDGNLVDGDGCSKYC